MMKTKKEKKRVPELRFEGFEGEWEEKSLVSKIDFIAGYAFKSSEMQNEKSKYQLIKMSNLYQSELQLDRNPSYWKELNSQTEKYLLKKNDILLTLTGTVGKKDYGYSIIIPEDNRFLLNQRLVCLRAVQEVSDAGFINNLIKTSKFYYSFFAESKGGTGNQTNVGVEDLRNIKLRFPFILEQQKIASFLTSIDTRIQQLEKKKTLLEEYKKGVMQKIFSQEIRFRDQDGKEFGEWEEKRLGELGETVNGLTGKTKDDFGVGKPYIQYKQIFDSSKINIDGCGLIDIKEGENQNKVQYGDVFFTTSSETQNEVATASVLLDEVDEMYLNSFCFGLRIDKNKMYPSFAQFIFRSNSFRKKMLPLAQGSTRYNISKTNFLKVKIEIPCLEEQTKIAHFLSALDRKIAVVDEQIEGTKEWKKGLLQRMFV